MMTNRWIFVAGLCSAGLTLVHVFGGGPDVYHPILETEMDNTLRGFVSVIWHAVTATLAMCSGMLIFAARRDEYCSLLSGIVLLYYVTFAGLFVFYGIYWTGNAFALQPWIGFVCISALVAIGLMTESRKPRVQVA